MLLVGGDRDPFFPPELLAALYRLLPAAELCVLPATGHMATRPADRFAAVALDFFGRHAESLG